MWFHTLQTSLFCWIKNQGQEDLCLYFYFITGKKFLHDDNIGASNVFFFKCEAVST